MELFFATAKLRTECLEPGKAVKAYGSSVAVEMRAALADLDAAIVVTDLPEFDTADLPGSTFRVAICEGWSLRFQATGVRDPDQLSWDKVYRVKLLGIEEDDGAIS